MYIIEILTQKLWDVYFPKAQKPNHATHALIRYENSDKSPSSFDGLIVYGSLDDCKDELGNH